MSRALVGLLLVAGLIWLGCDRSSPAGKPPPGSKTSRASEPEAKQQTVPVPRPSADPRKAGLDPFALDPDAFQKKRPPKPGDWLDRFSEPRQSFEAYMAGLPTRPTAKRKEIVIQPLGPFSPSEREMLDAMREFASIFFDVPVRIEETELLPNKGRRRRGGPKPWTQHHSMTVIDELLAPRLPPSAICYLGITMGDLYPKSSWNFVFGQASLDERVGVYSLARFFPSFTGETDTPKARNKALRRSIHILAHETGHMFSLPHCTENECLMNGSNSLDEMDRQVDVLCPVCLRKLQWNLKFGVIRRYERLRDFYRAHGLEELARWMDRRIERIAPVDR